MMNRKDVEAYQKSYEEIDVFLKQFPHLRHTVVGELNEAGSGYRAASGGGGDVARGDSEVGPCPGPVFFRRDRLYRVAFQGGARRNDADDHQSGEYPVADRRDGGRNDRLGLGYGCDR